MKSSSNMDNFIIRIANSSDVPFLADTIIEAEKSGTDRLSYTTIFGLAEVDAKKYISEMLLEEIDGCELSISSFLVAEIDGKIAAALSAWVEHENNISSAILKGNLIKYVLPKECIKNAMRVNSIISEINFDHVKNSIQIGAGYVAKEFRGNNLLGILNAEIIQRLSSSNQEVSYVYAQIYGCNTASAKIYEKANFELVEVKESLNKLILDYLPSNKKILMRKKL